LAGALPGVPWSSAMTALPFVFFWSHSAARRPSSMKSEPMKRDVERVVVGRDAPVREDDRNAGRLGFLAARAPSRCRRSAQQDHIDVLRDERADGADLVLLLLLGVVNFSSMPRLAASS
jgi:hypothetical protein